MSTKTVIWVRYTWSLNHFELCLPAPKGYVFDSASVEEAQTIIRVVLLAYGSDPTWQPIMMDIQKRMTEWILTTLGSDDSDYLVARTSSEIIALSGIAREHWTDQNLLTGICVLPQHQRKGIGRYLLGLSLMRLKEIGLSQAQVYTESGSLADRKVYPHFQSCREVGVRYPGAV